MVRLYLYPCSIYYVKFSSWLLHDFPVLNPAGSLIIVCCVIGFNWFRIICGNNLDVRHIKEIGLYLLSRDESLSGFRIAITLDFRHNFGIVFDTLMLFIILFSRISALGCTCLIYSYTMSSKPADLLFVRIVMPCISLS